MDAPGELDFDSLCTFEEAEAVPVLSTDPLYILYTSGTTGKPKGIIRDHGGYATALAFSMKMCMMHRQAMCSGQPAMWVGWLGCFIVYGPLLAGCTTVLYEGKPVRTPDAGAFWRVASEHRVNVMFTAPTAIRAIKKKTMKVIL